MTITTLAALARGNGGGTFDVHEGGKGKRRKSKAEATIDLHALCGGKITTLSRDVSTSCGAHHSIFCATLIAFQDVENLIVQLLVAGYMKETYNSTAYNIIAYVAPGGQSIRLTRLSLDKVQSGAGERVHMLIPPKPTKAKAPKSSGKGSNEATENKNSGPVRRNGSLADFVAKKNAGKGTDSRRNNAGKGKGKAKESDEDVVAETDDDQDNYGNDPDDMLLPDLPQHIVSDPDFEDDDPDETRHPSEEPPRERARAYQISSSVHTIVESEEEDDGWKFDLAAQRKTAAKSRVVEDWDEDEAEDSEPVQPRQKRRRNEEPEVITISDTD